MNWGWGRRRSRRWALLCGVSAAAAQGLMAASALADPAALRDVSGFMLTTVDNVDEGADTRTLGFGANWFGMNFTEVTVSTNGRILFGPQVPLDTLPVGDRDTASMPEPLNTLGRGTLAGFWTDLIAFEGVPDLPPPFVQIGRYTFGTGMIDGRDAFAATWIDVRNFSFDPVDGENTFQIVIIDRSDTGPGNFDVEFNYAQIESNIDVGFFEPIGAAIGFSDNQVGGTDFELTGSRTPGLFLDGTPSAVSANPFNSGVAGRLVFQVRNGITFAPMFIALTPFQQEVQRALNTFPLTGPFGQIIAGLLLANSDAARQGLEDVGGIELSAMGEASLRATDLQLDAIGDYLWQRGRTGGGLNLAGFDLAGRQLAATAQEAAVGLDPSARRFGAFASGRVVDGNEDRTENETEHDLTVIALTVGADYAVTEEVVVAFAVGTAQEEDDFNDGGSLEAQSYTYALYGTATPIENTHIDVAFAYTTTDFEFERRVPTIGGTANSDASGEQFGAQLRGGHDFGFGSVTVTPYGQIRYIDAQIDSFAERGAGILSLTVDNQDVESLTTRLGVDAAIGFALGAMTLTTSGGLAFEHEFDEDARTIDASFAGAPLTVLALPTDEPENRNALLVNLGASLAVSESVAVSATYVGRFFDDELQTNGAGLSVRFAL